MQDLTFDPEVVSRSGVTKLWTSAVMSCYYSRWIRVSWNEKTPSIETALTPFSNFSGGFWGAFFSWEMKDLPSKSTNGSSPSRNLHPDKCSAMRKTSHNCPKNACFSPNFWMRMPFLSPSLVPQPGRKLTPQLIFLGETPWRYGFLWSLPFPGKKFGDIESPNPFF